MRLVLALALLAGALAVAGALLPHGHNQPPAAQRIAVANYKVLTPVRSRRLLVFARAFRACVVGRGVELGAPEPSRTRITMRLGRHPRRLALLRITVGCGDRLGGPPHGSSLQYRPSVRAILLYLPKWCLLDPNVAGSP